MIDRGPYSKGYAWDLTKKTAKRLGFLDVGAGPVQATVTPGSLAGSPQDGVLGSGGAEDRGIRALQRQLGRRGEQALELGQRHLGDRLEDLVVAPAGLAGLLDQVVGRALSWSSVSSSRVSSACSFSSEDLNSRARATSSRPSPAARAVRAYWVRV